MKVLVVANTSWFIYNFQRAFIDELGRAGHEVVAVATRDDTVALLAQRDVRFVDVPLSRSGYNPLVEWRSIKALTRAYEIERPDTVFHSTIKPVIYGSYAARRAGIHKVFNMIPGLGYLFAGDRLQQRVLRPVVKLLYRSALKDSRRVFFQNPDDQRYFVDEGLVREERTEITWGLGVDLDRFQPVKDSHAGGRTFLLIARMLSEKGVNDFVAAAVRLRKELPDARFQLLGKVDTANPGAISADALREWNEAGMVEYLGEVEDVRPILANANVVVLPSYYREGIPNALLEAMGMGKPIITTDTPGCRDTVNHGDNGFLVPPRDVEALLAAMRALAIHPERQREMGMRGRAFAEERFDVKIVNGKLITALTMS